MSEAFEAMANELMERQKRGELTLAELRTKASNAFSVSVDGQGRISINPQLREYAGLEPNSPVVVAGDYERVSIWAPPRFAEQTALGAARLGAGA